MDYTLRNRVCRGIAKWWDLRNNLSVKKTHVNVNRVLIMLTRCFLRFGLIGLTLYILAQRHLTVSIRGIKKYSQLAGLAVSCIQGQNLLTLSCHSHDINNINIVENIYIHFSKLDSFNFSKQVF